MNQLDYLFEIHRPIHDFGLPKDIVRLTADLL